MGPLYLLVAIALTGCMAPRGRAVDPTQIVGTRASMLGNAALGLWQVSGDGQCESSWIAPATFCGDLRWLKFDGCRWRCASILELGAQQ